MASGRNYVVHSLRHTYVTALRGAVDVSTLQRLVGHASDRMVDHYTHRTALMELSSLERSRAAVETALFAEK